MSQTLADLVARLSHPEPELHRVLAKLAADVGASVAPQIPTATIPTAPPVPVKAPVPAPGASTPPVQAPTVATPTATPPPVKAPPAPASQPVAAPAPAPAPAWDGKTLNLQSAVKYPDAAAAYQKTLQAPLPATATPQDYLARGRALAAAHGSGLYGADLQPTGEGLQKAYLATPGATPQAWGDNSTLGIKDSVAARAGFDSAESMQTELSKAQNFPVPPALAQQLGVQPSQTGTIDLTALTPEQRQVVTQNVGDTAKMAVGAAEAAEKMSKLTGVGGEQVKQLRGAADAATAGAQQLQGAVASMNKAGPELQEAISALKAGTPELKQYVADVSKEAGKGALLQAKQYVEAGDKEGIMETIMRNPAALLVPAGLMLAMFGGDTGKILGVLAMAGGGFNLYQQYQGASDKGGPVVAAMASQGLRDYTAKGVNEFLASPAAAQHNFTPDMAHDALNAVLLLNHGSQDMVASAGAQAGQRASAWLYPDATAQAQQLAAQ